MKQARDVNGPPYVERVWLWTDSIDDTSNGSSGKVQENAGPVQTVQLENKVALIVGGASDTGATLALAFAERGMDVAVIFYEGRQQRAKALKERIEALGRRCLLIHGESSDDLGQDSFARWAVETILSTLGRLDVYINVSDKRFPLASSLDGGKQAEALQSGLFPQFAIMKAALDKIVG